MRQTNPRFIGFLTAMTLIIATHAAHAQELDEADVVQRALQNNPNLRGALLDLQASEQGVAAAEAEYTPLFRAGLGGGFDDSLGSSMVGASPGIDGSTSLEAGLSWTSAVGTTFSFDAVGSWSERDSTWGGDDDENSTMSSSTFAAEGRLRVTQPLLRGAGRDVGEASQRAARLDRTAAEHARDDAASQLIRDSVSAYWDLWYAQQAIEVTEESRELTERQLEETELRVDELGTATRADVLRFASEMANIEEEMTQARSDLRTSATALGQLLGLNPEDSLALSAAATAPARDVQIGLDEALEMARFESSALRELETGVAAAQDRVDVARDATLPRLDLTASLAAGGMWSQQLDDAGSSFYDGTPAYSGTVGLELELPLSNARAEANLSQARIRSEASEVRYESRRLQVETETLNALERLETARASVALTSQSVEIARELAAAEQEQLDLGTTTTFQVLEAQSSLRRAELRHLRALVNQSKAALTLQHLTGQLLPEYAQLTAEL